MSTKQKVQKCQPKLNYQFPTAQLLYKYLSMGLKYTGAESSGWGKYINRICDKDQDHKNMAYWMFLINGKLADEGAGSFKVKHGDVIEFRYSLTEIRHKPNSMYYPASYKKMT